MSSLYARDKAVWISFTDKRGHRMRRATGYTLKRTRKDAAGRMLWPPEALQLQKKLDANIVLGKWEFIEQKKTSPLFTSLLEEFISHRSGDRSAGTIRNYRLCAKEFTGVLGNHPVASYAEPELLRFRLQQLNKYSDHSAARVMTTLRTIFNWAVDSGYIEHNPVTKRVLVHPRPVPIVTFTDKELDALFEHLHTKDPDLERQLRFLWLSGFRSGESCSLKWERIDFDDRSIKHWNAKETRWEAYPIDKELIDLLRMTPRNREPFVFKYRNVCTVSHYTNVALADLGITGRTVHQLKKTYVKNLIRAGLSEAETHRLSHHKSIETTLKYYAEFDLSKLRKSLAKSRRPKKDVTIRSHKKALESSTPPSA